MPCLRLLVYALPPECRLMTIPQPCLDYFNDREKRYYIAIPASYVQDPRQVAGLSMSALKHNLELHKQANKDIMLTGTRVDLVDRLKGDIFALENVGEYEETRKLYPQWTGRRDKRGIPVYVYEVAHLNPKTLTAHEQASPIRGSKDSRKAPPRMLRLFALYENLVRFVLPLCSAIPDRPQPETPISLSNNIVDISGVSLKQFWNLKGHMQDASQLATAHYPETLDRIFIIGAPSFFPTVWSWIKRWFDPTTVSKIFILTPSNMKATLEQYIDPANIPKKYGGKLDFKFGMLPVIEPAISQRFSWEDPAMQNGLPTFPSGPIRLERNNDDNDMVALAVGSQKGKPRRQVVASIHAPSSRIANGITNGSRQPFDERRRLTLMRTTSGTATQSNIEEDPNFDQSPAGSESGNSTPIHQSLPYRNPTPVSTHTMDNTPSNANNGQATYADGTRSGTSSERYAAQHGTHAAGQMRDGTPATNDHGYGDTSQTMEPGTVGQAPKDVSVPQPEQPQPSYLDQAKSYANQAYEGGAGLAGTALAAAGIGGGKEEEKQEEPAERERKPRDPRVNKLPDKDVEEFVRSQYVTRNNPGTGGAAS
ncbi:hypothetical protein H2201_003465 [Coniosporium apollinis]|uniref:CRAL-TRIO domain-containing protein n=1 Tax=Coniosporium apollinis TaxID=61459 RepID=A0ABQ9NVX2_9PEZI|nr:hypothetical protein H2201_003465 [Coniosporium apollinis]